MISIVDPFCPDLFGAAEPHHVAADPAAVPPMPIRYLIFILGRRAWGRWGGLGYRAGLGFGPLWLPGWAGFGRVGDQS
jgi:hypothetical protein